MQEVDVGARGARGRGDKVRVSSVLKAKVPPVERRHSRNIVSTRKVTDPAKLQ